MNSSRSDCIIPKVKKAKAEVNKWKVALHSKSQSLFADLQATKTADVNCNTNASDEEEEHNYEIHQSLNQHSDNSQSN